MSLMTLLKAKEEVAVLTEAKAALETDKEQLATKLEAMTRAHEDVLDEATRVTGELSKANATITDLEKELAETKASVEAERKSLDKAAATKAAQIVATTGTDPVDFSEPGDAVENAENLWAQYHAIKDRWARHAFFKKHKEALLDS